MNGRAIKDAAVERGYLALEREWKPGDIVKLKLSMPVQRVAANPKVKADAGLLAIQRGRWCIAWSNATRASRWPRCFCGGIRPESGA